MFVFGIIAMVVRILTTLTVVLVRGLFSLIAGLVPLVLAAIEYSLAFLGWIGGVIYKGVFYIGEYVLAALAVLAGWTVRGVSQGSSLIIQSIATCVALLMPILIAFVQFPVRHKKTTVTVSAITIVVAISLIAPETLIYTIAAIFGGIVLIGIARMSIGLKPLTHTGRNAGLIIGLVAITTFIIELLFIPSAIPATLGGALGLIALLVGISYTSNIVEGNILSILLGDKNTK